MDIFKDATGFIDDMLGAGGLLFYAAIIIYAMFPSNDKKGITFIEKLARYSRVKTK